MSDLRLDRDLRTFVSQYLNVAPAERTEVDVIAEQISRLVKYEVAASHCLKGSPEWQQQRDNATSTRAAVTARIRKAVNGASA